VTQFQVTVEVQGFPADEAQFDQIADELYELDAADPDLDNMDITASLAKGEFFAAMTVDADDMPGALHKALAALRTAVHEAGFGTPGWEQMVASMAANVASTRQLVS
jgi:hypothetical protein